MSNITKQQIIELLSKIKIKNIDIITANIVSGLTIKERDIEFTLELDDSVKSFYETIITEAKHLLSTITDGKITIVATNKHKTYSDKYRIPDIGKIIIIASGKGGVGKSTLTVGLAIAAMKEGLKVGIIDADINGPSIAHMIGSIDRPIIEKDKIMPIDKLGIKFLSMGNFVDPNKAIIWRSAMYSKALSQIISKSNWGKLDVIFIDAPPGTGDIHLTIAQNYYIDKVVIISPPQKIALLDVTKAIDMYRKLEIPIIGIVQNIIQPINPKDSLNIFANNLDLKLLSTIQFDSKIIETLDKGLEEQDLDYISKKYKQTLLSIFS